MRVAIIGSRDYKHLGNVIQLVNALPADATVISGGAVGVDQTAARRAQERRLHTEEILPEYDRYGKAATLIRNGHIVRNADVVVAFWNGKSRGTKDAIDKAKRIGKRLVVCRDEPVPEPFIWAAQVASFSTPESTAAGAKMPPASI